MSKQWGHGYYVGLTEGEQDGLAKGYSKYNSVIEAEQINLLIEMLAQIISEEPCEKHWVLLRLISEINSKNMFNPDKAWHIKKSK